MGPTTTTATCPWLQMQIMECVPRVWVAAISVLGSAATRVGCRSRCAADVLASSSAMAVYTGPTSTPTRGTLLHKAGPRRESGSGGRDSRRAGAEKQTMSCERIAISQLAYSDRNERPVPAVPVMVSSKPHAFGMDAGSRGALVLSDRRARVHCGKLGSRFWLRHGTASLLLEHQRRLHIFSSRALGGLPSRGLACWDVPDRRRDRSEHGATCIAFREGDTATFTRAPGSNSDRLWSEAWAVRAMPDCTAYWDLRKGTAANIVGTGRAISGVAGVAVNR
ncbi:hypothetical protein BS50DRAFT_192356 [Corynespora cassiicola Philippines]|uniref:Uncharacterized protein n=1 Tax=Corynespora cassiicola Philippines TaxID=1448308 RepID=A0A2T2P7L8_CORCC|nr:hypothetical protein BS50DRAFT_192356 [Corynespora cassiicola Philippines]